MDGYAEISDDDIGDDHQISDSDGYDVVYISSGEECTTMAIPDEIVIEETFVMALTRRTINVGVTAADLMPPDKDNSYYQQSDSPIIYQ